MKVPIVASLDLTNDTQQQPEEIPSPTTNLDFKILVVLSTGIVFLCGLDNGYGRLARQYTKSIGFLLGKQKSVRINEIE